MSVAAPAPVVPNILVEDVEALRAFYLEKLGFEHRMGVVGRDGRLDLCIVMRGGALIMLSRPEQPSAAATIRPAPRPIELYIAVPDVDAYHEEVRRRVEVRAPLRTQWWGDRNFGVDDPCGYRLWFYQTLRAFSSVTPPAGVTVV
jgi:uncharacterized glyoxalase superfamily protein PhnB